MEPSTHRKRDASAASKNPGGPDSPQSGGIPLALLAWIIGIPGIIALLLLLL